MQKQTNSKNFLKLFLQFLIYALVAYYIYVRLSDNWDVFSRIDDFSISLFLFSIILFSTHAIWNGILWHYILNKPKLSRLCQLDVYLKSYMLRYIPGNVVGMLSRGLLNKRYGVPMVKSLFGWCYENLVYLVIGSILASFIVIRAGEDWPVFNLIPSVPFFIFIALLGFVFSLRIDWFEFWLKKYLLPRLPKKVKRETELLNLSLKKRVDIFFGFGFSWLIYSLSFLILVCSIDKSLLQANILDLLSVNALAWALGYLSFITPSGSGVREFVMIFALETFVGIDIEVAIIITLLARVVLVFGELISYFGFLSFKHIFNYAKCQK